MSGNATNRNRSMSDRQPIQGIGVLLSKGKRISYSIVQLLVFCLLLAATSAVIIAIAGFLLLR